jgi:hypothetical protein
MRRTKGVTGTASTDLPKFVRDNLARVEEGRARGYLRRFGVRPCEARFQDQPRFLDQVVQGEGNHQGQRRLDQQECGEPLAPRQPRKHPVQQMNGHRYQDQMHEVEAIRQPRRNPQPRRAEKPHRRAAPSTIAPPASAIRLDCASLS